MNIYRDIICDIYIYIYIYMYTCPPTVTVYAHICARFATPRPPPGILSRPPVVGCCAGGRAVGQVGGMQKC